MSRYEFLLEHRAAVRDYCLVQEAVDSVLLEIVPGEAWNEQIAVAIGKRFAGFLETGVSFRIAVVDKCEKTKTGKRNPIINPARRAVASV